jgi:hypothetical protein
VRQILEAASLRRFPCWLSCILRRTESHAAPGQYPLLRQTSVSKRRKARYGGGFPSVVAQRPSLVCSPARLQTGIHSVSAAAASAPGDAARTAAFFPLAMIRCHFLPSRIPEGRERRVHRQWGCRCLRQREMWVVGAKGRRERAVRRGR